MMAPPSHHPQAHSSTPQHNKRTISPISIVIGMTVGLISATVISWMIGILVEIVGIYFFWPEKGEKHSQDLVMEDLQYIAEFPRSILIDDTVGFAQLLATYAAWPFMKLHVIELAERYRSTEQNMSPINRNAHRLLRELTRYLVIAMYVAQDTFVRLAVVVFALPAFAMACLLGLVDGLVRRDIRKWSGGRESSFIYHHFKKITFWGLTGGFSLYLAWPIGGFNPAYMVLVFCAFVAWSLSMTVSSFKKYL